MKRLFCIAAALAAGISCFAQQGKVITETLRSEILDADRQYNIVLPESYEANPERSYPILYLLHGMYDTHECWTNKATVHMESARIAREGLAKEMIIVTPNAGGYDPVTEQNGYFNIPGWAYESFFFDEFIPHIESKYRVIADRSHRAIAGLSMGGGATISYALRHSDMFGSAYAMSAWVDISKYQKLHIEEAGKGKIIPLVRSVSENSVIDYVRNATDKQIEAARTVNWFIDCGDDDFLFDLNVEFYQAMKQRGVPCQLRVRDGGHTWEYWHTALATCLPFISVHFGE